METIELTVESGLPVMQSKDCRRRTGLGGEGQHSILAREQSGLSLVQLAHVRSEEAQGSAIGTRSSLS